MSCRREHLGNPIGLEKRIRRFLQGGAEYETISDALNIPVSQVKLLVPPKDHKYGHPNRLSYLDTGLI